MFPDWESNWQLLGAWNNTQPTKPHGLGNKRYFNSILTGLLSFERFGSRNGTFESARVEARSQLGKQ